MSDRANWDGRIGGNVGTLALHTQGPGTFYIGGTVNKKKPEVVVREVRVDGPFVLDEKRVRELQLTPRELEILGLIAQGLSNKEIAERVFVSENTVKTHASRVFDKLGARRRIEAVQLGKSCRLIP